jgi:hypothetical protein
MKYKSKCGYFYKIVSNKKIRISIEEYKSIKGGTIKNDGELAVSDFDKNSTYKTLTDIHSSPFGKITSDELNNIRLKVINNPWFLGNEPVLIFGSDNTSNHFLFACHNIGINLFKKVVFFKNPGIKIDIDNIDIKYLIELFWGLVNIRKNKKPNFMTTLYDTLMNYFSLDININKLTQLLSSDDIRKMIKTIKIKKYKRISKEFQNRSVNGKSISKLNIKNSINKFKGYDTPAAIIIIKELKRIDSEVKKLISSGIKNEEIKKYQTEQFEKLLEAIKIYKRNIS